MSSDENLIKIGRLIRAIFFRWSAFLLTFFVLAIFLGVVVGIYSLDENHPLVLLMMVFIGVPLLAIFYGTIFSISWHGIRGLKRLWSIIWTNYSILNDDSPTLLEEDHNLRPFTTSIVDDDREKMTTSIEQSFHFVTTFVIVGLFLAGLMASTGQNEVFEFSTPVLSAFIDLVLFIVPFPEDLIMSIAEALYNTNEKMGQIVVAYSLLAGFVSTIFSNNLIHIVEARLIEVYGESDHLKRGIFWVSSIVLTVLLFYFVHILTAR